MQQASHNALQDPLLDEERATSEAFSKPQKSPFSKWPASPSTLKNSSLPAFIRLLPSILLLLIPLAFYVLAILIYRLDGQLENPGHDDGDTVIQAMKVASTLWPILFAAVVGSMIKAITLFRAERGTKLGTLEVLATSQTLVSTLRECLFHRIISTWTPVLLVIWTLSPAGGQAVLRSVEAKIHRQSYDFPLRYYPSNDLWANLYASLFTGSSKVASAEKNLHRVVDAAISSPDATVLFSKGVSRGFDSAVERLGGEAQAAQSARMDLWGNVRIPFLHLLPDYNNDQRDKWVEIPPTEIAPYSSLVGHSIRKVPASSIGNFSLSLQTVYHTLKCTPWFNGTQWLQENPRRLRLHHQTNASIFTEVESSGNHANVFLDILYQGNENAHDLPVPEPFDNPSNKGHKAILVFGIRASLEYYSEINMTHCETTATYVETEVDCVRESKSGSLSCVASRMREAPDMPPSNWSSLNWGIYAPVDLLATIPNTIQSRTLEPSGIDLYLVDPPTSIGVTDFGSFDHVPLGIFQARLALIFNTFFQASLNTSNILGADGIDGVDPQDIDKFIQNQYTNTTATWTEFTPSKYEVQYSWFALYFAATTVLAICAVATVVISALTRAPDLFGGVSSLTRDSAFMTTVPDGGSLLSGSERARLLQDVWVRLQDVKPEDDVGRIAFSDQKELRPAAGLRWERKYK